jgi:hypothetical protein
MSGEAKAKQQKRKRNNKSTGNKEGRAPIGEKSVGSPAINIKYKESTYPCSRYFLLCILAEATGSGK